MIKKALCFANRYWGDFVFFLMSPLFVVFYLQAYNLLAGDLEHYIPVNRQLALALFYACLAYAIYGLIRVLFRKKRLLRDFCYLIAGVIAVLCFVWYIAPSSEITLFTTAWRFMSMTRILQQTIYVLYWTRGVIWLYKSYQRKQTKQALVLQGTITLPPDDPTQY